MPVTTASPASVSRFSVFLENIKFSHSVFALPFALAAMVVAAGGWPGWWTSWWVVVAAVAARTAAMSFNRLADVEFDARNPRTKRRPLVTGELSRRDVVLATVAASMVFAFAALMLNRTCFYLSTPVLAVLFGYSLTKRFTSYSHFFLGLALGLAPLGAWIAVGEPISAVPLLLSGAVICWVAGFDVLYSCQDFEVDSSDAQLHSLPKLLGMGGAMAFARRTHAAALAFFLCFWWSAGLGLPTLLGIAAVGALILYQHSIVSPRDLSRIDAAFFMANGLVSAVFFLAICADFIL